MLPVLDEFAPIVKFPIARNDRVPSAHAVSGDISVQVQSICAVWRSCLLPKSSPDTGVFQEQSRRSRITIVDEWFG